MDAVAPPYGGEFILPIGKRPVGTYAVLMPVDQVSKHGYNNTKTVKWGFTILSIF
jgi:hypothetical protein